MKKNISAIQLLLITGILSGAVFFAMSCSGLFPDPEDAPTDVFWVQVKTGITDSSYYGDFSDFSDQKYALALDSGGFFITWNRARKASYYEVRMSHQPITIDNWENAVLAASIDDRPVARMSATINTLLPGIKGNNCTGCEYCVAVCPNNAITMFRKKAVIDLSKCTACGKCYDTCNYNAVTSSFMGRNYYFAVRAFSENDEPSNALACTEYSYQLRYTYLHFLKREKKEGEKGVRIHELLETCGRCAKGCFILNDKLPGPGCPVNAIIIDTAGTVSNVDDANSKDMMYIDYTKCISCGNCLYKCVASGGLWTIRREVVESKCTTIK